MDDGNKSHRSSRFAVSGRELLLLTALFISGMTAIICQVVWGRVLVRVTGATLSAVTVLLSAYMFGLGAGALLGTKIWRRWKQPLLLYSAVEVVTGLIAIIYVGILFGNLFPTEVTRLVQMIEPGGASLSAGAVDSLLSVNLYLRQFIAFLLMVVPATFMGLVLPLASRSAGVDAARLYLANLLGSVLGALLVAFVLVPGLGLSASSYFAAGLSFFSGAVAFCASKIRSNDAAPAPDSEEAARLSSAGNTQQPLLSPQLWRRHLMLPSVLVAISGFISLFAEIIYTRLACLLLGASTYALSAVLTAVLFGLALGFGAINLFRHRASWGSDKIPFLFLTAAFLFCLQLLSIDRLPAAWLWFRSFISGFAGFEVELLAQFAFVLVCISPVFVVLGAVFPLALADPETVGPSDIRLGYLYGASTLGAVLGVVGARVLLPVFGRCSISGIDSCLVLLAVITALISVLPAPGRVRQKFAPFPVRVALAALPIALLLVRPAWNVAGFSSGLPFFSIEPDMKGAPSGDARKNLSVEEQYLFYREGANSTVSVSTNAVENLMQLRNDGKVEASLPLNSEQPSTASDLETQLLLGQLPVLFGPTEQLKVFVIGYGSGATCAAALASPMTRSCDVAELEPAVLAASSYFRENERWPGGGQNSGRLKILLSDARVSLSALSARYEAIVSQPPEPWVNGAADLYTKEFWQQTSARLVDRGVFCQWIQLYSIDEKYLRVLLKTFQSVYPNTYVFRAPRAGEVILVGLKSQERLNFPRLERRLKALRAEGVWLGNKFSDTTGLLTWMAATPQSLQNWLSERPATAFNTDDNLLTEYALLGELRGDEKLLARNLQLLHVDSGQWEKFFASANFTAKEQSERLSALALAQVGLGLTGTECDGAGDADGQALDAAFEMAGTALSLHKNSVTCLTHFRLAMAIAYQQGKFDAHPAQQALDAQLQAVEAPEAMPLFSLCLLGQLFEQDGRTDRAVQTLLMAVNKFPHQVSGHFVFGQVLFRQGLFKEARHQFELSLVDDPRAFDALLMLGRTLKELRQYSAAEAVFASMATIDPNCAAVHLELGKVYYHDEKVDDSLEQMRLAGKANPGNAFPNLFVTAHYALIGDWQAARVNLTLLKKKAPGEARTEQLNSVIDKAQDDAASAAFLRNILGFEPVVGGQHVSKCSRFHGGLHSNL